MFLYLTPFGKETSLYQQETPEQSNNLDNIEKEIPETPEIPEILDKIAMCESSNRHFNNSGEVLRGTINPSDIGKYQINEKYWKEKAEELGFDIYTEEGNEAMALWLYEHYGTKCWAWSKPCWGN